MAYAEIGRNIQAARKQLNMSREELAEKSGLSAKFIGNIERGEKAVSLDSFVCIANVLGASADSLLGSVLVNGYRVKPVCCVSESMRSRLRSEKRRSSCWKSFSEMKVE